MLGGNRLCCAERTRLNPMKTGLSLLSVWCRCLLCEVELTLVGEGVTRLCSGCS